MVLINKGAKVNAKDKVYHSVLVLFACAIGYFQNGNTPLHTAVARNQEACVNFLLDRNAQVEVYNNVSEMQLCLSASNVTFYVGWIHTIIFGYKGTKSITNWTIG